MTTTTPMCIWCKHYRGFDSETGEIVCTSFPKGIPEDIIWEGRDHYTSRAGEPTFLAKSKADAETVAAIWPPMGVR